VTAEDRVFVVGSEAALGRAEISLFVVGHSVSAVRETAEKPVFVVGQFEWGIQVTGEDRAFVGSAEALGRAEECVCVVGHSVSAVRETAERCVFAVGYSEWGIRGMAEKCVFGVGSAAEKCVFVAEYSELGIQAMAEGRAFVGSAAVREERAFAVLGRVPPKAAAAILFAAA
jgi:hypothetical protein